MTGLVDAHFHIWRQADLPWLMGPMQPRIFGPYEPIRRDYPVEEYLADCRPQGCTEAVYVLENLTGEGESAVYALVYDDRWIGNPYMLQLSSAVTSVWAARRPLTLVFAYGPVLENGHPVPVVAELLRTAVQGLQSSPQSAGT